MKILLCTMSKVEILPLVRGKFSTPPGNSCAADGIDGAAFRKEAGGGHCRLPRAGAGRKPRNHPAIRRESPRLRSSRCPAPGPVGCPRAGDGSQRLGPTTISKLPGAQELLSWCARR